MSILEYAELIAFYLFVAIFLYKTKIYRKTLNIFDKIVPPIYKIIIVLYPFFIFLLYIYICNLIISENIKPVSVEESDRLIDIVLNKFLSYFLELIFWTLVTSLVYYIVKRADKIDNENEIKIKIKILLKRIIYLLSVSNILLIIFLINIFLDGKILYIEAFQYVKNYNFNNLVIYNIFSDNSTTKIIIIFSFSLFIYFTLFFIPADFLNDTVTEYNKLYAENKINISYKILMYIPIINILFFHHIKVKYFNNFILHKNKSVV